MSPAQGNNSWSFIVKAYHGCQYFFIWTSLQRIDSVWLSIYFLWTTYCVCWLSRLDVVMVNTQTVAFSCNDFLVICLLGLFLPSVQQVVYGITEIYGLLGNQCSHFMCLWHTANSHVLTCEGYMPVCKGVKCVPLHMHWLDWGRMLMILSSCYDHGVCPVQCAHVVVYVMFCGYIIVLNGFSYFYYAFLSWLLHWHCGHLMIVPVPEQTECWAYFWYT